MSVSCTPSSVNRSTIVEPSYERFQSFCSVDSKKFVFSDNTYLYKIEILFNPHFGYRKLINVQHLLTSQWRLYRFEENEITNLEIMSVEKIKTNAGGLIILARDVLILDSTKKWKWFSIEFDHKNCIANIEEIFSSRIDHYQQFHSKMFLCHGYRKKKYLLVSIDDCQIWSFNLIKTLKPSGKRTYTIFWTGSITSRKQYHEEELLKDYVYVPMQNKLYFTGKSAQNSCFRQILNYNLNLKKYEVITTRPEARFNQFPIRHDVQCSLFDGENIVTSYQDCIEGVNTFSVWFLNLFNLTWSKVSVNGPEFLQWKLVLTPDKIMIVDTITWNTIVVHKNQLLSLKELSLNSLKKTNKIAFQTIEAYSLTLEKKSIRNFLKESFHFNPNTKINTILRNYAYLPLMIFDSQVFYNNEAVYQLNETGKLD